MEKTFCILKPDITKDGHVGEIITILEKNHFIIEKIKIETINEARALMLYSEHITKPFLPEVLNYMRSGPVVILCLSRINAVSELRNLIGTTNPSMAAEGTIRRLFGKSVGNNGIHGSDSINAARREIGIFFPEFAYLIDL